MDPDDNLATLLRAIKQICHLEALAPDDELLESGRVSSIDLVEIVMFLNTTFEIEIDPGDLVPENLNTPRRILDLVGLCHEAQVGSREPDSVASARRQS